MSEHYCTYFDHRFASRGLAMWRSLKGLDRSAILHVLCLNDSCQEILTNLAPDDVCLHSLSTLENDDRQLVQARSNRSLLEYYFTLTPCLLLDLFKSHPTVQRVTYLDADLFFFADPRPIFDEIGDASVGLIEHRFPAKLADRERFGRFNVGWITFRNDAISVSCLKRWKEQCLEWCYDRVESDRYADQRYLDDWPDRFEGVHIVQHPGANVAPWNLDRFETAVSGETLKVGGQPIIFFHAHGFEPSSPGRRRELNLARYAVEEISLWDNAVYKPYEQALLHATAEIAVPLTLALLADHTHDALMSKLEAGGADRSASLDMIHRLKAQLDASEANGSAQAHLIGTLQQTLRDGLPHEIRQSEVNAAFRAWIEAPLSGLASSTHLVVRGWCYQRNGNPIKGIRIRVGDRTFPGTYGESRPDVEAFYSGEHGSGRSGYEVPVGAVTAAASWTGELEAQLSDSSWHVVQVISVNVPRPRAASSRAKWGGFWWKAWRGRSQAWSRLDPSERDYVVARLRQRGWINLFVAQHYSPHPIRPERFPTRFGKQRLPRIAIVTPSFQQGAFLEQTISSVLNQKGVHISYIVQDGGSTDNSVDVIRRHASELVHWESAPDRGQAGGIARGFLHSSGDPDDLMMYLNSDDLLMNNAARFVAEYFARHPEIDVVYGHRVLIDEEDQEVGRWFTPRAASDELEMHDHVPQETLFWRRRIWDRVGGIDPAFKFALDWDLLLRFKAAGARFARLPWFLGCFRMHPHQKIRVCLTEIGIPEMNALRRRTLGRLPTPDELHLADCRAKVDSALVYALFQRGLRV